MFRLATIERETGAVTSVDVHHGSPLDSLAEAAARLPCW